MKKTIVIAGGGFAGITALDTLIKDRKLLPQGSELLLIDKKNTFDFLPMVPDVLAGWLQAKRARINLENYCSKNNIKFIEASITKIECEKSCLHLDAQIIFFDYLVIATGATPNFFGNKSAEKNCYCLNTVEDAFTIRAAIINYSRKSPVINIVVIGGGYTGMEAALNSHFFMRRNRINGNITIVEKLPVIMMMVNEWIRGAIRKEMSKNNIQIINNSALKEYENGIVKLDSGEIFDKAICIWTAGVKTPEFIKSINVEKIKSRIKVDEQLRIANQTYPNIFVVGDSAAFIDHGQKEPLRMAIMFAIEEAKIASQNIINLLNKNNLKTYKPKDLGYLIPLVYCNAPGIVLGKRVGGFIGYFMHYFMCIYRSRFNNKLGIVKDLILSRVFNIVK